MGKQTKKAGGKLLKALRRVMPTKDDKRLQTLRHRYENGRFATGPASDLLNLALKATRRRKANSSPDRAVQAAEYRSISHLAKMTGDRALIKLLRHWTPQRGDEPANNEQALIRALLATTSDQSLGRLLRNWKTGADNDPTNNQQALIRALLSATRDQALRITLRNWTLQVDEEPTDNQQALLEALRATTRDRTLKIALRNWKFQVDNARTNSRQAQVQASLTPTSAAADIYSIFDDTLPGYQDTSGLKPVTADLVPGERTGVFIVLGQSLAANNAETRYTPNSDRVQMLNPYDGKVYPCADPILGCSAEDGNVWGRLGDKLINAGTFDRIIFVCVAIGGTASVEWAPDGYHHHRLRVALSRCHQRGYPVSGILWSQGESDNEDGVLRAAYEANVGQLIAASRAAQYFGPWFICRETWLCGETDANIQAAQEALVDEHSDIYAGPNYDSLDASNRIEGDNTHFNATGAEAASELWKVKLSDHFA